MEDIFSQLLKKNLSPYRAIDLIRLDPNKYSPELKRMLSSHNSPYIRLCCAWFLGEIQERTSVGLLMKSYTRETDENARSNIVWAIFSTDPQKVTYQLLKQFLTDEYFVVPLITIKNISVLHRFCGKLGFKEYYKIYDQQYSKEGGTLIKIEMLRNIRHFYYTEENAISFLEQELKHSNHILLRLGLIEALSLLNSPDSMDILIRYYYDHEIEFLTNSSLALQFVTAVANLFRSKPYQILENLYLKHDLFLIKLKIIEVLGSLGGPECLTVLKRIYEIETNSGLRTEIDRMANIIQLTTV